MTTKGSYIVRELPWLKGSRRRMIDRYRHLHEAMREAETLSSNNRQTAVELRGVILATFLNGKQVGH
jgi:hypothetical protein